MIDADTLGTMDGEDVDHCDACSGTGIRSMWLERRAVEGDARRRVVAVGATCQVCRGSGRAVRVDATRTG